MGVSLNKKVRAHYTSINRPSGVTDGEERENASPGSSDVGLFSEMCLLRLPFGS